MLMARIDSMQAGFRVVGSRGLSLDPPIRSGDARMRKGSANTARGARRFIDEVVARVRRAGRQLPPRRIRTECCVEGDCHPGDRRGALNRLIGCRYCSAMGAPSLGRSAAVMAVGTVVSRVTGLGRLVAAAYAVGVNETPLADTYNIANTMPNVVYELVLGGILTSVFIPVVVEELRTKSREEAWEAVSSLVATALAVLLGIALFAAFAARG